MPGWLRSPTTGIHDGLDLWDVPWRRGRGYDVAALSDVYTSNDAWARLVYQQLEAHVDDLATMRCLGFCVSVEPSRFLAPASAAHRVSPVALAGASLTPDRHDAQPHFAPGRSLVLLPVPCFTARAASPFPTFNG